jgi:hypothetical protein
MPGDRFVLSERRIEGPFTRRRAMASMMTYLEARDALVMQLRQDATAHDAEQYDAVGRRFDALEHRFPTGTAVELGRLHIALTFWDGWVHARNHGWPPGPIGIKEWPKLARAIADELAADRDISDAKVLTHFNLVAHPHLNERVQILAARLRQSADRTV